MAQSDIFHIVVAHKTQKYNSELADTLKRLKQLKTYYKSRHTKKKIVVIAWRIFLPLSTTFLSNTFFCRVHC